ncbi:hypothetical protein [Streptomyces sp. NPDC055400]
MIAKPGIKTATAGHAGDDATAHGTWRGGQAAIAVTVSSFWLVT